MSIPFATDPWNEIIPNLWQGGHDYRPADSQWVEDAVPGQQFDVVVSLYRRAGHDDVAENVPHHICRIPDATLSDEGRAVVADAVGHTLTALDAGRKTLVRCQAGYNRSGLVVALVLLAKGWTADEAIGHIRRQRSEWALCNRHFVGLIRQRAENWAGAR